MDKIFLHGWRAETVIGVYEWERQHPQTLVLDLDIGLSQPFAQDEDIRHTVHYGNVCERVRENLATQQFLLLETLANHVVQFIFTEFDGVAWLKLRICKLGVLAGVREVGVEIERFKETV